MLVLHEGGGWWNPNQAIAGDLRPLQAQRRATVSH